MFGNTPFADAGDQAEFFLGGGAFSGEFCDEFAVENTKGRESVTGGLFAHPFAERSRKTLQGKGGCRGGLRCGKRRFRQDHAAGPVHPPGRADL